MGPGVLYAAAAVGASHLVQSTRAGASYGLALVLLILLTYVAKYPAFRFGAQYACATGNSLLHGYRNQGQWAVAIYVVIALGTMFAALPAVTLITAGLAKVAFQVSLAAAVANLVLAGSRTSQGLLRLLSTLLTKSRSTATFLDRDDARIADLFVTIRVAATISGSPPLVAKLAASRPGL